MSNNRLLFVDTNIWLDFYRSRTDAGLSLLKHLEAVKDRIITTYQVEIEFKKNRQTVIEQSLDDLKPPVTISPPRIISDAKKAKSLLRNIKAAQKHVSALKARLLRALENPSTNDPVYQTCQRCFHKNDAITLSRDSARKRWIERKAFRRFLHGCPPRKKNDTSIGDAINWEWIIECASACQSEIHIVSRDGDYGITIDGKSYLNDHLRQEFKERVSKKRKVFLHTKLTEALKGFQVAVSQEEVEEETEILQKPLIHVDSDAFKSMFADTLLKHFSSSGDSTKSRIVVDPSELMRLLESKQEEKPS